MTPGAAAPTARELLERAARAALAAVDAREATRHALDDAGLVGALRESPRLVVIAMGKAAPGMAQAVLERDWGCPVQGLVVTKDGHADGFDLGALELIESAHPVPDERSARAGRRALAVAAGCSSDDHLLVLLSGGASALVSLPPTGVAPEALAALNEALLGSGAPISELNAVRKHLSQIAGGRLARASRANRVSLLVISDVPGDDLGVIGSGPCSADSTTFADALEILRRRLRTEEVPESVARYVEEGAAGRHAETVKPGDEALDRVHHCIVACNGDARRAAAEAVRSLGMRAVDLGERLSGEARAFGRAAGVLAAAARNVQPTLLVTGGETVVRLAGAGRGGRNQELALAAAIALSGAAATVLAFGSDGGDGPTDAAGAFVDGSSIERAEALGMDARYHLDQNDAYPFFDALGDLLRSGPTGTNVMDLLLVWLPGVPPPEPE